MGWAELVTPGKHRRHSSCRSSTESNSCIIAARPHTASWLTDPPSYQKESVFTQQKEERGQTMQRDSLSPCLFVRYIDYVIFPRRRESLAATMKYFNIY